MTDYEDYENNLAFKPIGDWADTEPKVNTDRTQSSLELVDKIADLSRKVIELTNKNKALEDNIDELKDMLAYCRDLLGGSYISDDVDDLIADIDKALGD